MRVAELLSTQHFQRFFFCSSSFRSNDFYTFEAFTNDDATSIITSYLLKRVFLGEQCHWCNISSIFICQFRFLLLFFWYVESWRFVRSQEWEIGISAAFVVTQMSPNVLFAERTFFLLLVILCYIFENRKNLHFCCILVFCAFDNFNGIITSIWTENIKNR